MIINLPLKAKHFKNIKFHCLYDSVIEIALKSYFLSKDIDVHEAKYFCIIENECYNHIHYDEHLFEHDYEKAESLSFSNQIIRFIKLTKII